ncbi:acyl-CoA dehydrogenase, partial [Francisella tularensis subsp. holarctica]|nr:acyl-CoA dehydrogenase [Francisella tularensis subsp. holarctica]
KAKDVFIPIDWIIGEQKMAGEGWRMIVECLSIGRAISLPACGTDNTLMSAVITAAFASVRVQFKVPIAQFEGVQEKL